MFKTLKYIRFYLNKYFLLYLPNSIYDKFPLNLKDLSASILFHAENKNDIFFIQIGSNDGITGDPLHDLIIQHNFKGILIEPVNYLYKKLLKTYSGQSNLIFKNVAIAEKRGYKSFYRIKKNNEANMFYWYDQLGSFKKSVVLKHKEMITNFNSYFIKEKVKCITLNNLIKENKVQKIDLIHIDTEGYDYELIKLIPFKRVKPKMILYENKHLSNKDKNKCEKYLEKNNYSLISFGDDTFAHL